ncbi:MAG: glucosaminidase domain-containing protein [Peptostreptococcaceae bacterium]
MFDIKKPSYLIAGVIILFSFNTSFATNDIHVKDNVVDYMEEDILDKGFILELTEEEILKQEEEKQRLEELLKHEQNLNYIEQMKIVDDTILLIEDDYKIILENILTLNNEINESKENLINLEREYNLIRQNTGDKKFSDLELFEMVLSSDSFTELIKRLNIAQQMIILNNKELGQLKEKQDIENKIIEVKNKELDELIVIDSDFKVKLDAHYKQKEELVSLMGRKSDAIGFNPLNVLEISNLSVDDMYKGLYGTALYELAPVFIECENEYGINAVFLASLAAHESAWGTSRRAVEDNNLTGFGVYSDSAVGINAYSKRDNLLQTTKWLKERYLTKGAIYYNGLSIQAINTRYCIGVNGLSDFNWSTGIQRISNTIFNRINSDINI